MHLSIRNSLTMYIRRDISQLKSVDNEMGNLLFLSTLVGTLLPTEVESKRRVTPFINIYIRLSVHIDT